MFSLCKTMVGSLMALLVIGTFPHSAQAQTVLRFRFKAGETVKYDHISQMRIKVKDPANDGKDVEVTFEGSAQLALVVKSVDKAGKAEVKCQMLRVAATVDDGMGNKQTIDTDDPKTFKDDNDKKQFEALCQGFTVTIDGLGNVSGVKLPPNLEKALKQSIFVGILGGAEQIKILANPLGLLFPTDAIAKGASLNGQPLEAQMENGVKLLQVNTFSYEGQFQAGGKTLEKFTVNQAGRIVLDPKRADELKPKIEGGGQGFAIFDNTLGRLLEARMHGKFVIEIGANKGHFTYDTTLKLQAAK
jgi:hypothetical protein